jgi:integrase
MKGGRDHRVPLSDAAMAVVRKMDAARRNEFVFPGRDQPQVGGDALLKLLRKMGRREITVHGFRSTFRDWCSECTDFPRELAEAALAHVVGDKVEIAYRRGDALEKRRRLMSAWADHCDGVEASGVVVPLRAS